MYVRFSFFCNLQRHFMYLFVYRANVWSFSMRSTMPYPVWWRTNIFVCFFFFVKQIIVNCERERKDSRIYRNDYEYSNLLKIAKKKRTERHSISDMNKSPFSCVWCFAFNHKKSNDSSGKKCKKERWMSFAHHYNS